MNARKAELALAMADARDRTMLLLGITPDEFWNVRVHDFYSPIGWHFGHMAMTEEQWTLCGAMGRQPLDPALSFLFANIPENPKDQRVRLPRRPDVVEYMEAIRHATLVGLDGADLTSADPLLADGYAWEFVYRHECQHQETLTELLQIIAMRQSEPAGDIRSAAPDPEPAQMVRIPGGCILVGSDDRHDYDNEKAVHRVDVAPFELDPTPVTAADWSRFMADGGYANSALWSDAGWAWRLREHAERPACWLSTGSGSPTCLPGCYGPLGARPLDPQEPVTGVSWYEAEAYARWAGKRLPTEVEWEYAARWDPCGDPRLYPWGDEPPTAERASFGLERWRPDAVGAHPAGRSAFGLLDMAGGAWEWTRTPFLPYPGFQPFPYDGYSAEHMDGSHFVCRGGSWATSAPILRCSFRNWYVPTYRQGLLGLRCAR